LALRSLRRLVTLRQANIQLTEIFLLIIEWQLSTWGWICHLDDGAHLQSSPFLKTLAPTTQGYLKKLINSPLI
jgi:hypothetical protein